MTYPIRLEKKQLGYSNFTLFIYFVDFDFSEGLNKKLRRVPHLFVIEE